MINDVKLAFKIFNNKIKNPSMVEYQNNNALKDALFLDCLKEARATLKVNGIM